MPKPPQACYIFINGALILLPPQQDRQFSRKVGVHQVKLGRGNPSCHNFTLTAELAGQSDGQRSIYESVRKQTLEQISIKPGKITCSSLQTKL